MDKTEYYIKRTFEHIRRVQDNMVYLVTKFPEKFLLSDIQIHVLIQNVAHHDLSKFNNVQWGPYIELTEYYRQRKKLGNESYEYPAGVEKQIEGAIQSHYNSENHHPEGLNGTYWDIYMGLECACDLQAMAQEFGEGSARKYYENVWKQKQSKYFKDDGNWAQAQMWMETAIECFEKNL